MHTYPPAPQEHGICDPAAPEGRTTVHPHHPPADATGGFIPLDGRQREPGQSLEQRGRQLATTSGLAFDPLAPPMEQGKSNPLVRKRPPLKEHEVLHAHPELTPPGATPGQLNEHFARADLVIFQPSRSPPSNNAIRCC